MSNSRKRNEAPTNNHEFELKANPDEYSIFDIPYEIISHEMVPRISEYSSIQTTGNLSSTCRTFNGLFKQPLEQAAASTLLSYVMSAQPEEASRFIRNYNAHDPSFASKAIICKTSGVERHNQRYWSHISPWQFAIWAGDVFIARLLLDNIQDTDLPTALQQMKKIRRYNGCEHKSALFQFSLLVDFYDLLIHMQPGLPEPCQSENYIYFLGRAQLALPMYGIQEYCDQKQSFFLNYNFLSEPDRLCLDLINNPIDFDRLGTKVALQKYLLNGAFQSMSYIMPAHLQADKDAIANLVTQRKSDFNELERVIENRINLSKAQSFEGNKKARHCMPGFMGS